MRRHNLALLLLLALSAAAAETPSDLDLVWEYPTPRASPQALLPDRSGRSLLYAALKDGGLAILELQGDRPPRQAALITTEQLGGLHTMHLAQSNNRQYLALGDFFSAAGSPAGLGVTDVSEPKSPRVLTRTPQRGAHPGRLRAAPVHGATGRPPACWQVSSPYSACCSCS